MIWLLIIAIVGVAAIATIWSIARLRSERRDKHAILKEALNRENDIKEALNEVEEKIRTTGNDALANSVRDSLIRRRESRHGN